MLKTLSFCLLACCVSLFAPFTLQAAGIAVLSHVDITPYRLAIAGFREQVNVDVQEYHLGRKNEHQAEVQAALQQQKPDLVFAVGKTALNFARKMKHRAPVVFVFVLHPNSSLSNEPPTRAVESGITMSIAPGKQFEMLLNIAPEMRRVAVVYDARKSAAMIKQASAAARRLGIELIALPVSDQRGAAYAIADVMPKVDAMWMIPDTTVLTRTTFKQMQRLSLSHGVALIGLAAKYVRAGSLFALSFDSRAMGLQAGDMANRILQGKLLPKLVSPDVLRFVLNKQTADRLALNLSAGLLKKAARVYPDRHGEGH